MADLPRTRCQFWKGFISGALGGGMSGPFSWFLFGLAFGTLFGFVFFAGGFAGLDGVAGGFGSLTAPGVTGAAGSAPAGRRLGANTFCRRIAWGGVGAVVLVRRKSGFGCLRRLFYFFRIPSPAARPLTGVQERRLQAK